MFVKPSWRSCSSATCCGATQTLGGNSVSVNVVVSSVSVATPGADGNTWVVGAYVSYQATEKLSFHGRGEYVRDEAYYFSDKSKLGMYEFTATIQYDLWKNVLSRVEFRWDHSENGDMFGEDSDGDPDQENACMLAANIVYKF